MGDTRENKFVFSSNDAASWHPILDDEGFSELSYYDIDECFLALSNEECFERFKSVVSEDTFGDAEDLLDSFKKLVLYFRALGYQFSDEEKRRVSELIDYEVINRDDATSEELMEVNELYTLLKIISDAEFYKTYLSLTDDSYINGLKKRYCEDNMITALRKHKMFIGKFSSNISDRTIRFTLLGTLQKGDFAFVPDIVPLDKEFEEAIMSQISSHIVDDEDLAKEIYRSLNKICELIPRQYTEGFSDDTFYHELESLSVKDINLNNRGVTCGVWCDLYWQLLNKYTNLKCFISGKRDMAAYHKYVVLLTKDGRCISADGVGSIYDKRNKTKMCDITREKLGLSLTNFGDYEKLKKEGRFSFDGSCDDYDHDMELYRITQLIGLDRAKQLLQDAMDGDIEDYLEGKFRVVSQIIYDSRGVDNHTLRSLCNNLVHICFNDTERSVIKFNDLYTKELSDYPYVISFTIISKDNEYNQYILDTNDGFHKITCSELKGLIDTGRLIKINPNDKIIGIDSFPVLKK